MRFVLGPYAADWRGNRIDRYKIWHVKGQPAGSPARIIDVCTSQDVVEQLRLLGAGACSVLPLPPEQQTEYTHRLHYPTGAPTEDVLKMLEKVLTVQVRHLDLVIAADWYNNPPDDTHDKWWHSVPGELVNKAKYRWDTGLNDRARSSLAVGLAQMVDRHPALVAAHAVITVPGHKTGVLSCSEDLAERVATKLGKPLVRTQVRSAERPQAKEGPQATEAQLNDMSDEYSMPLSLSDQSVIVIDDVLRTGNTMSAVALAARRAGATTILGLVPARTRKVRG